MGSIVQLNAVTSKVAWGGKYDNGKAGGVFNAKG